MAEKPVVNKLRGFLHIFYETGVEGAHWAFQDAKFIEKTPVSIRWYPQGLRTINTGDMLVVYADDSYSEVLWQGIIDFSDQKYRSVHKTPTNVNPSLWHDWFHRELPAELSKKPA